MFKSMKLGTKIAGGFTILIVIALVMSYMGWSSMNNVAAYIKVSDEVTIVRQLVQDGRGHIKDFLSQGFEVSGGDGKNGIERYEDVYVQQQNVFNDVLTSDKLTSADRKMVDKAIKNCREYKAGTEAIANARKTKDEAFEEWKRLGWAVTDKVNTAMDEIINPARIAAESAGDIDEMKRWSNIGSKLDQNVIEPFLLMRVTAVYLIATNAEEQWTGYVKQSKNAMDGAQSWAGLVSGDSRLSSAADQIIGYLNDYKAAGDNYHNAILTSNMEYESIIATAEEMTGNMDELQALIHERVDGEIAQANTLLIMLAIIGLSLGVLLAIFITRAITKPINQIINGLNRGAEQVSSASEQVASAGQSLAEGASEQASSLEETSSSLEEMASMTRQNADNAKQANDLAGEASGSAIKGASAMDDMSNAINEIKKSSDETAKIIRVIDEIAFQTNLLALNAAVEAARAGEAGKGFAVVAEEVRNLAQRSAEAAKNTSALIEGSQKNSDNGVRVTEELVGILREIAGSSEKVSSLIAEVSAATSEQAQGIEQVNTAIAQMDQVTQAVAANAEESSSASEELSAQAQELQEIVEDLTCVVHGASAKLEHSTKPAYSGGKFTKHSPIMKVTAGQPVRKAEPARPQAESASSIIPLEEEEVEF